MKKVDVYKGAHHNAWCDVSNTYALHVINLVTQDKPDELVMLYRNGCDIDITEFSNEPS